MMYTNLTKKAMKLAFEAHKNQVDKNGIPYIYHITHVAEQMKEEKTICVALLHDIVEDTNITIEDLKKEGFSEEIICAIQLLTHDESIPYMDYVKEIKKNPIATKVKLADLAHNSDLTRLDNIDEYAKKRVEKYECAIQLLKNEMMPITVATLSEYGAIFFERIQEGLQNYNSHIVKQSEQEAYLFFGNKIKQYGENNCFADFYYFRLEQEAREKVDTLLTLQEKNYLCSIQPIQEQETHFIFPLNNKLLSIIVKLNANEMLFSTLYFISNGILPRLTYWGNYNQEYVQFQDKGNFVE